MATNPSQPRAARPRRGLRRALLLALGAACLHGSWAFFANQGGGTSTALRAALTQACLSFTATLVQVVLLEMLFNLGRTPKEAFCAAAFGTSAIGTSVAITAHAIAGTPHILATVTPTTAVGVTFNVLCAWQLHTAATRTCSSTYAYAGA